MDTIMKFSVYLAFGVFGVFSPGTFGHRIQFKLNMHLPDLVLLGGLYSVKSKSVANLGRAKPPIKPPNQAI